MSGQQLGAVIGAAFGLVYVLVNAGPLPPWVSLPLRVLGGVAFVAVLVAVHRRRDHGAPGRGGGFGRGYWLVVAAEAAALAAGLWALGGPLDAPQAGVAWVSFVVGVHFFPLAAVFREPFFHRLGGAITACGVAGLALVAAGVSAAVPVAVISGLVPGALLLASGWWGAHQTERREELPTSRSGGPHT